MGVHGLWELLLPVGRRVDSGAVSRKTVAVDMSIWLTQFVRAMRDADGDMVRNAHLLGVLRRCCKLLFLGVRPVFVFDGATPALKRRTLMMRAAARDGQAAKLRRVAERLLMNRLKMDILSGGGEGNGMGRGRGKGKGKGRGKPPLPVAAPPPASVDDGARAMDRFLDGAAAAAEDVAGVKRDSIAHDTQNDSVVAAVDDDAEADEEETEGPGLAAFDDDGEVFIPGDGAEEDGDAQGIALPDDIRELDDEALLNLPGAMQAAVFRQIKQQQRAKHREEVLDMQIDPAAFSKAQIAGFMSNTALNKRIANVRRAINDRSGASRRIASDSLREYLLEEGAPEPEVERSNPRRPRSRGAKSIFDEEDDDDDDGDDDDDEEWEDGRGGQGDVDEDADENDILRKVRREQNGGRFALRPEGMSDGRIPSRATRETAGVAWATKVLSNGGGHTLGGSPAKATGHHVLGGEDNHGGEGNGRSGALSAAARLRRLQSGFREGDDEDGEEERSDSDEVDEWEDGIAGNAAGGSSSGNVEAKAVDAVAALENESDDDTQWEDGVIGQAGDVTDDAIVELPKSSLSKLPFSSRRVDTGPVRTRAARIPSRVASEKAFEAADKPCLADLQSAGLSALATVFSAANSTASPAARGGEGISLSAGDGDSGSAVGAIVDPAVVATSNLETETEIEPSVPSPEIQSEIQSEIQPAGRPVTRVKKSVTFADVDAQISKGREEREERAMQIALAASLLDSKAGDQTVAASELADDTTRGRALEDEELQAALRESARDEKIRLEANDKVVRSDEKDDDDDDDDDDCDDNDNDGIPEDLIAIHGSGVSSSDRNEPDVHLIGDAARRDLSGHAKVTTAEPIKPGTTTAQSDFASTAEESFDGGDAKAVSLDTSASFAPAAEREVRKDRRDTAHTTPASASDVEPRSVRKVDGTVDARREEAEVVVPLVSEDPKLVAAKLVAEAAALESEDAGAPEVVNQLTDADIARLQGEIGEENASLEREGRSLRGSTQSLTDEMYGETRDLLRLLGLPYLEAPMEAEAQCAYLNEIGLVDAVLTEDSDAFLFGAKVVYRHLFANGKFAESYDSACILSELGVNRERFIQLALLLGSDYTPGVRGVGIVNAMEVLQAFPGQEGLRLFKEWSRSVSIADKEPEEEELKSETQDAVRRRFCWKHRNMKRNWEIHDAFPSPMVVDAYMKPVVDTSDKPFSWHPVDVPGLAQFCWKKFAWGPEKFNEAMNPVLKQVESFRSGGSGQTVIQDFFKPHRFAKIRSERLQSAVKGIAGSDSAPLLAGPREKKTRVHKNSVGEDERQLKRQKGSKQGKSKATADGRRRFRRPGVVDDNEIGGAVEEIGSGDDDEGGPSDAACE